MCWLLKIHPWQLSTLLPRLAAELQVSHTDPLQRTELVSFCDYHAPPQCAYLSAIFAHQEAGQPVWVKSVAYRVYNTIDVCSWCSCKVRRSYVEQIITHTAHRICWYVEINSNVRRVFSNNSGSRICIVPHTESAHDKFNLSLVNVCRRGIRVFIQR